MTTRARTVETVDELREWIALGMRGRGYMSADEVLAWCKRTVGDHVDECTVLLQLARLVRQGVVVKEARGYSAASGPA